MSTWRKGKEVQAPAEFLDLLFDQDTSESDGDECFDDETVDFKDEDRSLSPEALSNSPQMSPELCDRLSEMDWDPSSPEAPDYSPLSSPERRERLPKMEPETPPRAASLDRSRSPIDRYSSESVPEPSDVVLQFYNEKGMLLDSDDEGEFLALDTHDLCVSQEERVRDRCNRRRISVRRDGRRDVRGGRGQSARGRGYPNRGHRGHQWKVGHPLNEIWINDQDVPPELASLTTDVSRRRLTRMQGTARVKRNFKRQDASESESEDEYLDASDGAYTLPKLKGQNLHFEWSSMGSFQGQEENFKPERTGSVHVFNSAYDAFRTYWDDDVLELIVAETNLYATKISSVSFQSAWSRTNIHEILCLFAFWMMLGIIKMPTIPSCFSLDPLLRTEIFRRIFTRNRYELLTRALNFVSNNPSTSNAGDKSIDRLTPIMTHLNSRFQSNYILSKDICIDESITLWKGKLSIKQCTSNNASKVGIKTFELCESTTGYLWSFILHTGKESKTDLEQDLGEPELSTAIVKKLIGPLLNKGHRLFMDNSYNSPALARFLKLNGTDCVGTLKPRRDVPDLINKAPLNRGEYIARHSGDVCVLSWQDKKRVTMISTCHGSSIALPTVSSKTSYWPVPYKPQVVLDYNRFMGGVDLKDHMLEPYLLERKRCNKWYMKLFKRLLNVSILNSYTLLQSSTQTHHNNLAFRLELVNSILTHHLSHCPKNRNFTPCISRARYTTASRVTTFTHWPVAIKSLSLETSVLGVPNTMFRKRCGFCLKNGKTTIKTPFICEACNVPLCLKCFKPFHT